MWRVDTAVQVSDVSHDFCYKLISVHKKVDGCYRHICADV